MPSAFAQAFIKKAKNVFPKAKGHKHRTGKQFGPAPVPDGSFSAVVTAEVGVSKNKQIPFVRFNAAITTGQYEGLEPSKAFFCEGKPVPTDPDEFPTAEQQLIGLLEFLLPDIQIDDISQVEQAVEEVNSRGPLCIIGVRNRKGTDDKEYQDVFFNKVVKDRTFEDTQSSGEQEETGDTETTQSEESADTDSDVPEYEPAKGDMVTLDGDDNEYEVVQVSQTRKTANLIDQDGTRKNGIAWADLAQL